MFGLTRRRAETTPHDTSTLRVAPVGDPAFDLLVGHLPWVLFLRVGDAFMADEAGWWIIPQPGGAVALSVDCPGLEAAMRGPLRPALDGADTLLWLDLAEPISHLRGRAGRLGVARLPTGTAAALAADPTAQRLPSVVDAPLLP